MELTVLNFRLASRGAHFGDGSLYITYRNVFLSIATSLVPAYMLYLQQFILSVIGVPATLLAGWAVERPYIGRKGTLAISAGE